jgi:hypothetical protein
MLTDGKPGQYNTAADFGTYAGVRPRYFTLYYWRGRLSLVRIVMNSVYFDDVVEALETKYGPPSTAQRGSVKTVAGANLENTALRWQRSTSAITALRYAGRVDESEIRYMLSDWEEASLRMRGEAKQKAANDM